MDLLEYCNEVLSSRYGIEARDLGLDDAIEDGRLQCQAEVEAEIERLADKYRLEEI